MPLQSKSCERCGSVFLAPHRLSRFCCKRCYRTSYAEAKPMRTMGTDLGLAKSTVGAVSELSVCVDLMKRGFHTFRALSAHCPCDLMIFKTNGPTLRVEVKSGTISADGRRAYVPPTNDQFDVLALVYPDGVIEYRPPLD